MLFILLTSDKTIDCTYLVEIFIVQCCTEWFLVTEHLPPHAQLLIIQTRFQSSEFTGPYQEDAGVRVEIEGRGEVGLEGLTAMAALDAKLVLNVPHSKLLYGSEGGREGGRGVRKRGGKGGREGGRTDGKSILI